MTTEESTKEFYQYMLKIGAAFVTLITIAWYRYAKPADLMMIVMATIIEIWTESEQ